MSQKNVQFTVAAHIAAVLGYRYGEDVTSAILAGSVNAEPTFVRRSIAKLAKAGIVSATRGKNGACTLARPPQDVSLLDIYRASAAPATFAIHDYDVQPVCPVSDHIKESMAEVLDDAQAGFEARLAARTLASLIDSIQLKERP
ncbi:Rrf2 family transcriptional regulator [Pseudoduganella aquatica]|uniref:BadM/Rrf2 family transcriptional regulator n=1 Tax=Pseudoduganella aquatica TaxID=2660641 RepID=A0A7X4KNW2_9BURK|nr:Rrf2 family transcriptional regulator [Pseudoduganella aquatica]MYN09658.1 BadM/Rrf2 family transcriptional regulator [Pseudoduganella aquatica]